MERQYSKNPRSFSLPWALAFRWFSFCVAFKNVVTSSKKHVSANNPPTQILIKQRGYNLPNQIQGFPLFCTCFLLLRLRVVFILPFFLFCTALAGTHTTLFFLSWPKARMPAFLLYQVCFILALAYSFKSHWGLFKLYTFAISWHAQLIQICSPRLRDFSGIVAVILWKRGPKKTLPKRTQREWWEMQRAHVENPP